MKPLHRLVLVLLASITALPTTVTRALAQAPDDGDPAAPCEDDAECDASEVCVDGFCQLADEDEEGPVELPGDACQQDAECPVGNLCVACECIPEQGVCRADSDCPSGQICELVSVASGGSGEPDGGGGDPVEAPLMCEDTMGYCAVDYANIEADPRCKPFCELALNCGGGDEPVSGGGSSEPGDPGMEEAEQPQTEADQCVSLCSYLFLDDVAAAEMQALIDCINAHEGLTCDDVGMTCQGELEVLSGAVEEVAGATAVPGGEIDAPGPGENQDGAGQGSLGGLFGGGDEGGGAKGGAENSDGADAGAEGSGEANADDEDNGAADCSLSGTRSPVSLAFVLLGAFGLRLARRRR